MGWLHDYQDVNRFGSPRGIEQGTRTRRKAAAGFGRFNESSGIPAVLQHSTDCLQTRSPRVSLQSPRGQSPRGHWSQPDAGVPSCKTAALANHAQSPRGPCRMEPYHLEEFVYSPRRQLQRGASCPPARTNPITHTGSTRTDPLALRALDYGHLVTRQRSLRKCGYTAQSATGKLNLKTHDQTSSELHHQARGMTASLGLNSASLAGEEDIMPARVRPQASDKDVSARYTKVINRRDLAYIDSSNLVNLGDQRLSSKSLRTTGELYECLGQGTPAPVLSEPPSRRSSPPASEAGLQPRFIQVQGPAEGDQTRLKLFQDPLRA